MITETLSSMLIGGLVYDAFKYGGNYCIENIKDVLKNLILTDEEKNIIANELILASEENRNSKDHLIEYIENKAPETQKIIQKYNTFYNQNQYNENGDNILHTGPGDIIVNKNTEQNLKKS